MNVLDSVKVVIGAETKGFQGVKGEFRAMTDGAQRSMENLKGTIAGFFTIAAGKELVSSVTRMAERWKDISEQTDLSTDKVQQYDAYLKKVGLTIEDLQSAFDVLGDKRQDALKNGGESLRQFERLGISHGTLASKKRNDEILFGLNPDNRAGIIDMFGAKKGSKIGAGIRSVQEGGEVPIAKAEDIKILDDASKAFERAALEFKIAAVPLSAAIVDLVSRIINVAGGKNEKLETNDAGDVAVAPLKVARGVGSMLDLLGEINETEDKNREMEQILANAKRKGRKWRDISSKSGVTAPGSFLPSFSLKPERSTVELDNQRNALQDAAFGMVF